MIPRLVTFDCAQTLVRVPENWSMGWFAGKCAQHIGLGVNGEDEAVYQQMFVGRMQLFLAINRSRDMARANEFWRQLAFDWLTSIDQPTDAVESLQQASDELGFGPNSIMFQLFDDVIPCLDMLESRGIKAAIVSNWDYSLHRVIRTFGLADRFVTVKASLEEGVEKPDPELFYIALREAGFRPEDTLHVGDSEEDDLAGARAAGIRAVLIDRSTKKAGRIFTLTELTEAFDWIA